MTNRARPIPVVAILGSTNHFLLTNFTLHGRLKLEREDITMYILLIILHLSDGRTIQTKTFTDKEQCISARNAVNNDSNSHIGPASCTLVQ